MFSQLKSSSHLCLVELSILSIVGAELLDEEDDPCANKHCGWGATCVVANSEAHCQCPSHCSLEYGRTCGSDGKTYESPCLLRLATCESQGEITKKHMGFCKRSQECPTKCTSGNRDQPVCGSDGKTYDNLCELDKVACISVTKLVKVSEGKCRPKCDPACPKIYRPVCGSDGRIYVNLCVLKGTACKENRDIKPVAMDKCPTKKPPIAKQRRKLLSVCPPNPED